MVADVQRAPASRSLSGALTGTTSYLMSSDLGKHCLSSSGGGTRTHNLRVNSPPLCRIELPRKEWSQETGRRRSAGSSVDGFGLRKSRFVAGGG